MNVLSIGNSFSQDAHRYIHGIARADKVDLTTVNLYIGGCPLEAHFRNMHSERAVYSAELNGQSTGFFVSIKEALLSREWDVVTVQQVSNGSVDFNTYMPYLTELVAYVKKYAPKAKIGVHQTWAYEQGSDRLNKMMGYSDHTEMFADLKDAYKKAADEIGADTFIPSGELFQKLLSSGIEKIHRDTFHATLGTGRYALGLLWYAVLCGKDVSGNTFADFDEEVPPQHIEIVKKCVKELA